MTDTEEIEEEVANDLTSSVPTFLGVDNCPGVDGSSREYGSASLAEVLNSVPSLAAPAVCASEGAAEFLRPQPNPRHVMSPNLSQNLPQDPFHWQAPKQEADTIVRSDNWPVQCEEDGASSVSAPEAFESVSGSSRVAVPTRAGQASSSGNGRSYEPERVDSRQNVPTDPELRAPWPGVVDELRSVQQSCRQLKAQVESVASNADVTEVAARHDAIMIRIERMETSVKSVMQDQNHAIGSIRPR